MHENIGISIIGSGMVGTATGKGLAKLGYPVIFNDISDDRLTELRFEGYQTTPETSDAVASTSVSFICAQTPAFGDAYDLTFVEKAVVAVAEALQEKKGHHLVVVRSTVLPGTCRKILLPLLLRHSKSEPFEGCSFCYNPEFLRESTALEDFLHPSRIVIGENDLDSGNLLHRMYSRLGAPIIRTNFDAAEMIKLVSNAFLATKISFFNEIFVLCRKLGIDDRIISEAVSLDPRIGKYGVVGGQPFGGSCLSKDAKVFVQYLHDLHVNPDLLQTVLKINEEIRAYRCDGNA